MPFEENMLLEFNQDLKSNEAPSLIYGDLESLIRKISECRDNLGTSFPLKGSGHIPCD